jgi:hypothetical protein
MLQRRTTCCNEGHMLRTTCCNAGHHVADNMLQRRAACCGQHIATQDNDGDENFHVYAVDLALDVVRDLTPFQGIKAQVRAVLTGTRRYSRGTGRHSRGTRRYSRGIRRYYARSRGTLGPKSRHPLEHSQGQPHGHAYVLQRY